MVNRTLKDAMGDDTSKLQFEDDTLMMLVPLVDLNHLNKTLNRLSLFCKPDILKPTICSQKARFNNFLLPISGDLNDSRKANHFPRSLLSRSFSHYSPRIRVSLDLINKIAKRLNNLCKPTTFYNVSRKLTRLVVIRILRRSSFIGRFNY